MNQIRLQRDDMFQTIRENYMKFYEEQRKRIEDFKLEMESTPVENSPVTPQEVPKEQHVEVNPLEELLQKVLNNDSSLTEISNLHSVPDEFIHKLFKGLQTNNKVTYVDLSKDKIGNPFVEDICELFEKNSSIEDFHLDGWTFQSHDIDLIVASLRKNTKLVEVTMGSEDDQGKIDGVLEEKE